MTDASPRPRTPVRRWLCRGALAAAVIVGLTTAYVVYDRWQQRRAWQAACAEADRLDPGWRWEDLAAKQPLLPDEQNSVVRARAAVRLYPAPPRNSRTFDYESLLPQHRPDAQVVAGLREFLEAAGPALAEARRIADCPDGCVVFASPMILDEYPESLGFHNVASGLLCSQLVLQVEQGDPDAALVTVRALVHLSRPLAEGPVMTNVLVASDFRRMIAWGVERVLAQGEPSLAAVDAARRLLGQEANRPLILAALRGERAFFEDAIRALDEGRLSWPDVYRLNWFYGRGLHLGWRGYDRSLVRFRRSNFGHRNVAAAVRHLTWVIERQRKSPDGPGTWAAEEAALRDQLPAEVAAWAAHRGG
jgi:hypothetical protein